MKIEFMDGLLFASITIMHQGKAKTLENVVIDTGATKSIISSDAAEELNIVPEKDDEIVVMRGIGGKQRSLRKKIDGIHFGSFEIHDTYLDFGLLDSDMNGLIGLDILLNGRFIIDLENMEIYQRHQGQARNALQNDGLSSDKL